MTSSNHIRENSSVTPIHTHHFNSHFPATLGTASCQDDSPNSPVPKDKVFVTGYTPFLSPNQQCQCTEENSKH